MANLTETKKLDPITLYTNNNQDCVSEKENSSLTVDLSLEVWEEIFSYLTTNDVINFCEAFPETYFLLRDKNIIRNFDISGNYLFIEKSLLKYLNEHVSYTYIRHLNINKIYWVEVNVLRSVLQKLPNLEELLALNTKLSFKPKDIVLYKKLTTLAVSVHIADFMHNMDISYYKNNLYMLRRLCCHVPTRNKTVTSGLCTLFPELMALKEVWICDTDDMNTVAIKYDALVVHLQFLNKLVIKSRANIAFLDYKAFGLAKYFESRRFKSIVMKYERLPADQIIPLKNVSIFEPFESTLEKAWDLLRTYKSEMPYDDEAHRVIYMTKQITEVNFRELNFFHHKCFCTPEYINATLVFLRSKNSKRLKKLSTKTCILQRTPVPKGYSVERLERKYRIVEVIKNCPNLTTLELMQCSSCNVTILNAYPYITNWTKLERFTLEVPSYLDGKFLIEMFKTCKNLQFVRIISYNTNENLNRYICHALPHATALRDLHFENKHVHLKEVFSSLLKINSNNLRRIVLRCDYMVKECCHVKYIGVVLQEFIERNPQLLFLLVGLANKSRTDLQQLQEILNPFQKDRPAKFFRVKKNSELLNSKTVFMEVHKDLYTYDSEVSTIDMYTFK
ncbi:uncharacterized protein LOC126736264 [Anthonomus grandis grandis]|uniref:uncharacterized protein LOC126736264 n=1 Tax=Anthonomus grandis grandis TaxID=2921223 RepID=UPI00216668BA|nr:uncharacterized protein LOC126736264 [Anthonomus grandis grandis]XP_050296492.1 uncharacterized protein LOC126736264 [Anthonomus grandis grandis]XP_050296493.1 uncharacterized protein LOC126736264 [Anthonomus grandis grandis]XP_050296494.1 uncharacterized protein LOC126736264 [Anthonomus grandis grandis]XP_050296495.1 uncharacterized protein LOC126736264 [Anthonomus grandis grandis]